MDKTKSYRTANRLCDTPGCDSKSEPGSSKCAYHFAVSAWGQEKIDAFYKALKLKREKIMAKQKLRPPLNLPEWLARLPGDARITSVELAGIINSTAAGAISAGLKKAIPLPEKMPTNIGRHGYKYVWTVQSIRDWHRDYWEQEAARNAEPKKPEAVSLAKTAPANTRKRVDLDIGESLYLDSSIKIVHFTNSTVNLETIETVGGEKLLKITRVG